MAFITADRVKDTSTTTGTGNITVSGSAPFGYRTFSTVLSVSDTFYYCIQGQGTSEWEVGLGTYTSSNQFARTTVLSSSASGSAVSFSSGTKSVFITLPAAKTFQLDPSQALTPGAVLYGTGNSTVGYTAAGTVGQILTSNATGAPTWNTVSGTGTVTSVAVSGGSTGLTTSGGPITTSGTITLAGTLATANGGTGGTATPTAGTIPYGTGTALAYSAAGTSGQVLMSGGAGAPTWATVTGTGTVTSVNVSGGTTGLTYSGGPITGSGTITMAGTLAVANGGTGLTTNGPVFSAYQSTLQALSAATTTTCIYQTEEYDIGGCYNNTSSTVTLNGLSVPAWCFCPNVAGYYMVNFAIRAPQVGEIAPLIFKNGVSYKGGTNVATSGANNFQGAANAIVYLNGTGDYVSAAVYSQGALNTTTGIQNSYFQACMVRGA